jgi:hypothetical protein
MRVARGPRFGVPVIAAALAVAMFSAAPAHAQVNQNPVNSVPPTPTTAENTVNAPSALTFSAGNGNQISVSDPDAGAAVIQVAFNTIHQNTNNRVGTISLASTAGLTFVTGDGVNDEGMTFQGTISDINAALDGMTYTPTLNLMGPGAGFLRITTNDLGNTGTGGQKTDQDGVFVDINPADSNPDNIIVPGLGTYRNVDKQLSLSNLNNLSVKEWDGDDSVPLSLSLTVSHGTLTLASTTGLTFTGGANGTASMAFSGAWQAINAALENVTFSPPVGFTGDVTITMNSQEESGGMFSDSDMSTIRVDAPEDSIYWATAKNTPGGIPGGIGRAELDGGGGGFLASGPEVNDIPTGTAIDAVEGRIYWSITPTFTTTPSIYSANLDGTDKELFLNTNMEPATTKMNAVNALAIDQETRRIYWANQNALPAGAGDRGISYVSLDAPTDASRAGFIDAGATGPPENNSSPRGLALDLEHDRVYWTNSSHGSIGYAPLPGASGTTGTFTVTGTVNQAQGIAVDLSSSPERLFWTNGSGDVPAERLKVADLADPFDPNITGVAHPLTPLGGGGLRTPAIDFDANRIYYANSGSNTVSYANLSAGGGGGANVAVTAGTVNSPDGVSILRAPEPVSPPAIGGTTVTGSALTCSGGVWKPDQPNASLYRTGRSEFEWTLNGTPIPGATGSSYVPTQAGTYGCSQRVMNFAGSSAQDGGTLAVAAAPVATPTPTPTPETDEACDALRKKLKKAKSKKQRKKLKRKLRQNDC